MWDSTLADHEMLFVQKLPVGGPDLDSPVSRTIGGDGLAAVGAVAGPWIPPHAHPHLLLQTVAAIPAMQHRRRLRRPEARIEEEVPWTRGVPGRVALPVAR